ncbi:MAG: HAD family hydrolase [Sedimentisphaerales bacterium]|nr:HAD family hydrolase [Sedimentisphaerales bacterium]
MDFVTVEAADCSIGFQAYIAPFGQVSQEILNPASGLYQFAPDVTVLTAESNSLSKSPLEASTQLVTLSNAFKENGTGILIVCTFMANPAWPMHILHTEHDVQLTEANQLLREHFANDSRAQICDLDSIAAYYGYANAISPEMTAMAKIPFSEGFMALLAKKLVSHLKAKAGIIRKCLVLDCDNTLWGGIIGEDGMEGIVLGQDWPGREYVNFQKTILELYHQGVILAINSKNNVQDVMQVLREHPYMVLKEEHFAAIIVNWDAKPQNMEKLAEQVNIGLDSLVFVDDNPAERQLMRLMLPQVEVLDLPDNPALFEKTLRETAFFAKPTLTEEDKKRGRSYAEQRKRMELQKSCVSLDEYLKSLEMVCSIRPAEQKDIKRAAQLTQRTNQFNLTTRRYSEADITTMLGNQNWRIYVLGLKDKFGDNGTVGLALVETQAKFWRLDTFLMSCRVIGRQAEDAFVDRICRDAIEAGCVKVTAEYIPTAKNNLVADFWDKMGFRKLASDKIAAAYELLLKEYKQKTLKFLNWSN